MILAGGRGSRLHDLTNKVAKPAVAYGGKYRIVDFPLSNCANSGVDVVGVLTQYESVLLNSYVAKGNKQKLTIRFDMFETPVFIEVPTGNGETKKAEYIVTFDVEVFPNVNNYRTHKVINEMDLTPVHRADTGTDQPQGSGKQDPSNQSIAQYREYVNRMEGSEGLQTQAEMLRQMEALKSQYRKELEEVELERAFLHGFNMEE